ncbi:hypothetical protein [Thermogymnomonas acidicola]|uniref:hypothetical protein n=1 Tax=Thermogymnomonas acidicola TaxID=399579 RepID=UPI0013967BBF|nr:hypothetical protein [Thermogymnomonas acidicola]
MLYYAYGLLVIPDIACFIAVMVEGLTANRLIAYIAPPLAFSIFVILLVYGSNRTAVLLITFLGMAEAVFIFVLDTSMFSSPPAGHALMASSFAGTIFALLAFSGSGSSIFVSEDSEKPGKYVPYSIVSTVLLGGGHDGLLLPGRLQVPGPEPPCIHTGPFLPVLLPQRYPAAPPRLSLHHLLLHERDHAHRRVRQRMRRAVDSMRTDGVLKQGEWRLAFPPVVPLAVSVLAEYALTSASGFTAPLRSWQPWLLCALRRSIYFQTPL